MVFPAFLADSVAETLQQTLPIGHIVAGEPFRWTGRRRQAMAVLTEKRSPVHEPVPCGIIDRASDDHRTFLMCREHLLRPISRHNHVIFNNRYDLSPGFSECHSSKLRDTYFGSGV